jgi:antirestriction protein ArdC
MEPDHRSPQETIPATDPASPGEFLQFDPKTEAQKKAAGLIEQGVEKLLEDPAGFFRFHAKFHRYSPNNALLIMMQKPDATRCASYDTWKSLGRHVRKGESGIKIFFPMFRFYTHEDPDTGEEVKGKVLTGFGVGNTWDASQTDGEPLPEEPTIVDELGVTEASIEVDRRASSYLLGEGVRLARSPMRARGVYATDVNVIALNVDLPYGDILTTKTLMHEASHWAGDHRIGDKRDLETVAEASAFMALNHFGIDTSEYTFPYVATWAEDMNRLRQNLGAAQKISTQLIDAVGREDLSQMGGWL